MKKFIIIYRLLLLGVILLFFMNLKAQTCFDSVKVDKKAQKVSMNIECYDVIATEYNRLEQSEDECVKVIASMENENKILKEKVYNCELYSSKIKFVSDSMEAIYNRTNKMLQGTMGTNATLANTIENEKDNRKWYFMGGGAVATITYGVIRFFILPSFSK